MTKGERVQAALRREPTDRPPFAFWRHFPATDRNPAALAQSTLRFHERYGSDFLVVRPAAGHFVADWGCVEGDEVAPDGCRPCARHAVRDPGDWRDIRALDPGGTGWGLQLETLLRCALDRRADGPVLPTLPSPLSLARRLAGDRLRYDLRENTQAVLDALEAIAETVLRFAETCAAEGLDGMLYDVEAASAGLHSEEDYARFGEPRDRRIVESARQWSRLTIVQAPRDTPLFSRLAGLPAHAWSWDARGSRPPLREGHALVTGAVVGGLSLSTTLVHGTVEEAVAEAREALAQTGGRGIILGAGGVLPAGASDASLVGLARALGGQVRLAGIPPR